MGEELERKTSLESEGAAQAKADAKAPVSVKAVDPTQEIPDIRVLRGRNERRKYIMAIIFIVSVFILSVVEYINFQGSLSANQRASYLAILFVEFIAFISYIWWLARETNAQIKAIRENNRLLRQHEEMARSLAIIENLGSDFDSICYIVICDDKASDTSELFRTGDTFTEKIPGWETEASFTKRLDLLKEYAVIPDDRDRFYSQTRREVIFDHLRGESAYFVDFRMDLDGAIRYYQIKFTADRDEANSRFRGIIAGIHCIDEEKRRETEVRSQLESLVEARTTELQTKNLDLSRLSEGVFELLGDLVEGRDEESGQHIQRVKGFTFILANKVKEMLPEYGLTDPDVGLITFTSTLHDVGKIGISDSILLKPGKLSPEEFEQMKRHCELGCRLIKKMSRFWPDRYLNCSLDICMYHHEKWDGCGYPMGLIGDEIPISAQIVSIADCFDALTTRRVYKDAYDPATAFEMILSGQCGAFSDKLMRCFIACREEFEKLVADSEGYMEVQKTFEAHRERDNMLLDVNAATLPMIKLLAEQMPGGFFIYKAGGDEELIYFNDFMVQCLGCDNADDFRAFTHNSFKGIVHPDEYDTVTATINDQIKASSDQNDHVRYRVVRKDGGVRWINDYGHLTTSKDYGEIFYVFIQDETEAHLLDEVEKTSALLSGEQKRLENILEAIRDNSMAGSILNGISILVVDDDELSREICKDLLESAGAIVSQAVDGQDAVDKIRDPETAYDAVLMDIMMPVMDGIDATKLVRKLKAGTTDYLPIIALTADGTKEMATLCMRAGANGCMRKPLDIVELSRILLTCMKERSALMEQKLADTIRLANTDALTHVKNVSAYNGRLADLGSRINLTVKPEFAIVMCDVNNLKQVNDTYGHDYGDLYIKNCCRIICEVFARSPVYRIGGDEFVAILEGHDYRHRERKLANLCDLILDAEKIGDYPSGKASMSYGLSVYDPEKDTAVADVVKRADQEMYKNKRRMKARPDYVI